MRYQDSVSVGTALSKAAKPDNAPPEWDTWNEARQNKWRQRQGNLRAQAGHAQNLVNDALAAERARYRPDRLARLAKVPLPGWAKAGVVGGAAGGAYLVGGRSRNRAKEPSRGRQVGGVSIGAGTGALGATGAYVGGGYALKYGAVGAQRSHQKQVQEHVRGIVGHPKYPEGVDPASAEGRKLYRQYRQEAIPKFNQAWESVPHHVPGHGWSHLGRRVYGAGWIGRRQALVLGSGALIGGAAGLGHQSRHKMVETGRKR
jgi:hypothetical protein